MKPRSVGCAVIPSSLSAAPSSIAARSVSLRAGAPAVWGDSGDEQVRQSLRQTLVALRRALSANKPSSSKAVPARV